MISANVSVFDLANRLPKPMVQATKAPNRILTMDVSPTYTLPNQSSFTGFIYMNLFHFMQNL